MTVHACDGVTSSPQEVVFSDSDEDESSPKKDRRSEKGERPGPTSSKVRNAVDANCSASTLPPFA